MLYWGTSGFSYADWAGIFYPKGIQRRDWLRFYATRFNAVELNATYYAIPDVKTISTMAAKTPDGFMFSVKANQEMTHQRRENDGVFTAFALMLQPFIEAGKLGCVLAQFPYSFHDTAENRGYIELFRQRLGALPLVTEFRNIEWIKPEIYPWLRSLGIGFCCVDEPSLPKLMPPVAEATCSTGYIRFHGRNAAKWWEHQNAWERYDYTYAASELAEWVPKIKGIAGAARNTFVFANNHWQGQAVDTIRQLKLMFD